MIPSELAEFVREAKRNGYASGKPPLVNPDGSKTLTFKRDILDYADTWYGTDNFGGEEIVRQYGIRVWHMCYHGGITKHIVSSGEVFKFLQEALSLVPKDQPFRGPSEFKRGDFVYKNFPTGNIESFKGHEEVLYKEEVVHVVEYFGGRVD
jgi:hypothetical protein